jgi:hypothetical protein
MLPLTYTQTAELKNRLDTIDELRKNLLAVPLSGKNEMKFRWEAHATRIHSSLTLARILFSRGQIVKILGSRTKHVPSDYQDVLRYQNALRYIEEYWSASPKPVIIHTITTIAQIALPNPVDVIVRSIASVENPVKMTLDYLAMQHEHPVIQAGIALCIFSSDAGIPMDNGVVARLISAVFLAKYGYDCRGLLAPEKQWVAKTEEYETTLTAHHKDGHLNRWLTFYTVTLEEHLRERLQDLSDPKFRQEFPSSYWDLSERQKSILRFLEEPTNVITNAKVQSAYDVSQITASRDLSRLATLGLIVPHGKGRSVSYTRT